MKSIARVKFLVLNFNENISIEIIANENIANKNIAILKIANDTHAYCKLSGLLTEMAAEQIPNAYEILKPLVDQLIEAFGAERIMWGSDWPVVCLAGGYARWNDLTQALLKDLDPASQNAILFKTAEQFYGLEGVRS